MSTLNTERRNAYVAELESQEGQDVASTTRAFMIRAVHLIWNQAYVAGWNGCKEAMAKHLEQME